jgi:replication-associated recombination protein RarA
MRIPALAVLCTLVLCQEASAQMISQPRTADLAKMWPTTLDEVVGQEHILGPGKRLRRVIEADRLTNVIFNGPPVRGA